jgi:hypothetical protein
MKKLKPLTPQKTAKRLLEAAQDRVNNLLALHDLEQSPNDDWWFDALGGLDEDYTPGHLNGGGQSGSRAASKSSNAAGESRPAAECHRLDLIEMQSVLYLLKRAWRKKKGYKVYALLSQAMDLVTELRIAPSEASGEEALGIEGELIEQSDDLYAFLRALFLLERADLPEELAFSLEPPRSSDPEAPF